MPAGIAPLSMERVEVVRVLSVGPVESGCVVHDALRNRLHTHLAITPDYRRLWTIPKQDCFHIVVLHNSLSAAELEETCRFIRRQWPQARILVVRFAEEVLEDALYDERIAPVATHETLQATFDRLAEEPRLTATLRSRNRQGASQR